MIMLCISLGTSTPVNNGYPWNNFPGHYNHTSSHSFKALLSLGFRRALVTDVSRDGTLEGPGLAAAAFVAKEGFLVQASGGLKEISDLEPLKGIPGVVGTISGKALLEGFVSLEDPRTRTALEGTA